MDELAGQEKQPESQRGTAYHMIVWLILAVVVAGYMFFQRSSSKQVEAEQGGQAQMLLMSRYILGMDQLGETFSFQLDEKMADDLIGQLSELAGTPSDHIRVAIMTAEVLDLKDGVEVLTGLENGGPSEALSEDIRILKQLYAEGAAAVPDKARSRIQERYGWFGKLALTHDAPAEDPMRKEVIAKSFRTLWTVLSVFAILFGILLLAFAGWGVFLLLHFFGNRRFKWRSGYLEDELAQGPGRIVFLEVAILLLLSLMASSFFAGFLPVNLGWAAFLIPLCVLFWFPFRGVSWSTATRGLGWHRGKGVIREVFAGVAGYLGGIPILFVGFLITVFLVRFADGPPEHPIVNRFEGAGSGMLFGLFILACVAAPILEETVFRGAFYHYLRGRGSAILSALLTGLIFAAIHPQGFAAIPVLASIGVVLALIREWRGSLIAPMVAHGCNNFAVLILLAVTVT